MWLQKTQTNLLDSKKSKFKKNYRSYALSEAEPVISLINVDWGKSFIKKFMNEEPGLNEFVKDKEATLTDAPLNFV